MPVFSESGVWHLPNAQPHTQSVSLQFLFLSVNMLGILLLAGTVNGFTLLEIENGFLHGSGLPSLHVGIQTYFQILFRQSSSTERLAGLYFPSEVKLCKIPCYFLSSQITLLNSETWLRLKMGSVIPAYFFLCTHSSQP